MKRRALLLTLALAAPGLAGCDGGDLLAHGVSRAPVIQIVPGVSAPSAPVVTVLRTKKVTPPQPVDQPAALDEPDQTPWPAAIPWPMAGPLTPPGSTPPAAAPRAPAGPVLLRP